jgi:hypothetical protein
MLIENKKMRSSSGTSTNVAKAPPHAAELTTNPQSIFDWIHRIVQRLDMMLRMKVLLSWFTLCVLRLLGRRSWLTTKFSREKSDLISEKFQHWSHPNIPISLFPKTTIKIPLSSNSHSLS